MDELFLVALCESDEDLAWDAKWALQRLGTQEILDRVLRLCTSTCGVEDASVPTSLGNSVFRTAHFPRSPFVLSSTC